MRVVAAVLQQVVGEGREVQVVVDEELLGRNVLGDLHERAIRTERHGERKLLFGLRVGDDIARHERVCQRRGAEVQEGLEQ